MDHSLPGSSVHGILQATILEWVAIVFSSIYIYVCMYVFFIIGDWNAKVRSQEIPGVTGKFGLGVQNVAGQTQFCQENTMVIANTFFQQHKRQLYTPTSPDGQYRNQIDYIICNQRWRSSIWLAKTRLGANCGSDHELIIAKFRLKMK